MTLGEVFDFAHGEPVTVYHATATTDRYGNEVLTYAAGATYERCSVSPRSSATDELTDRGRTGVVIGLQVFLPPHAVVGPHDRMEVRGDMYEIVGDPHRYHHPFTGWEPGISVAIRRVTG